MLIFKTKHTEKTFYIALLYASVFLAGRLNAAAAPLELPAASIGTNASDTAATGPVSLSIAPSAGIPPAPDSGSGPGQTHSYPHARHEFGTVSLLDTNTVEKTFTLKNTGSSAVTLARLQASCGCLSALVEEADTKGSSSASSNSPAPLRGVKILPGQEKQVKVSVSLPGLRPGPLTKSVLVYVAEQPDRPAAQIDMVGTLAPAVSFSTPQPLLDFGRVKAGEEHSVILTATFDSRLFDGVAAETVSSPAAIPPLAPSGQNPHITVTLLPPDAATASQEAGTATKKGPQQQQIQRRYRLTLAKAAPLGLLSDLLTFAAAQPNAAAAVALTSPATGNPAAATTRLMAWRSVALPIAGEIVGDVSAQPSMIAFGMTNAGQSVTRRITLTAARATLLKGVTITTNGINGNSSTAVADIAARIVENPSAAGPEAAPAAAGAGTTATAATATLEVTLPASARPGPVQARVALTFSNGQRLYVPINGYIVPRDSPAAAPSAGASFRSMPSSPSPSSLPSRPASSPAR